jgi:hypothetical protein
MSITTDAAPAQPLDSGSDDGIPVETTTRRQRIIAIFVIVVGLKLLTMIRRKF